MVGSVILQLPNSHIILSLSLFHLVKSYGCRMKCAKAFNFMSTNNCNTVQNLLYTQTKVCNNYNNIFTITKITIITQYLLTATLKIHEC